VSKNGPYLVSGGVPLSEQTIVCEADGNATEWHTGKAIPAPKNYALCRCGQSKNKPFCDGSHVKAHFDGTETATRKPYLEQAETTDGPSLKLTDAEALCSGTRFCHLGGGTWELTEKSDDPVARKLAIEEAAKCPSGRLVTWDKNGKAIEPKREPSIGVVDNPHEHARGPLWVRGGIPVESADGTSYEVRNRVTLCRCGRSANKPFCDAAHLDDEAKPHS